MTAMFYIIRYLAEMPALEKMSGGNSARLILSLGVWVVAVFALVFLFYTNSFLMRRRKKEFGLYNILGMGKKNLSMLYVQETLILYAASMLFGIAGGIALSKLAELGLTRLLNGKIHYDFTVNGKAILYTLAVFGIIFCLLFIRGIIGLWRLNAKALLQSEAVGEKPPRANYLLGIGGIVLLAAAYYIAVSITEPLLALTWFFIAVIAVIAATYLIFISGSVLLCKLLRKNKNYYYKKKHFVSVSSMLYRMKRNGAGLASICILSTMVLVMMLGAGSLYFGAEESLLARYPKDFSVSVGFNSEAETQVYTPEKVAYLTDQIEKTLAKFGADPQNTEYYTCGDVTALLENGILNPDRAAVNAADVSNMKDVCQVYFIPIEDYNRCMGTNETLAENEVLFYGIRYDYGRPDITLPDGTVLKVKSHTDKMMKNGTAAANAVPSVFLVVKDLSVLDGLPSCNPKFRFDFDTVLEDEDEIRLSETLSLKMGELGLQEGNNGFYSYSVDCRAAERADFYGSYGGIFFLGILLSIVFLLATVLIIYYKQISEGYEDEARFAILQKVGMTPKDIRQNVNSQMRTVFFLPLITAVLHLCFAFPMVQRLLLLFNLKNIPLMIAVLIVSVLVFGIFYGVIYKMTSNAYCSIVSGDKKRA